MTAVHLLYLQEWGEQTYLTHTFSANARVLTAQNQGRAIKVAEHTKW